MEKQELINKASYAIMKGYDYEKFMYSDEMYGQEEFMDDVWEYVEECEEIGRVAFREKYKDYKMYAI